MNRIECGCTESEFSVKKINSTADCSILLECGKDILQECGKPIKIEIQ